MEEDEFVAALESVLEEYTDSTYEQILRLLAIIPEQATQLDFVVFPAQDGDGFFEVRASVSGPDLYVINKAIRAHADLFVAKHTETAIEPAIPIVDPFDTDYPVNDMVVDCVAICNGSGSPSTT